MPTEPVRSKDIQVEAFTTDALRLVIEPGEPVVERRTDEVWSKLLASNERLFDAPILAHRSVEGDDVRCVVETYRNFAVQDEIDLGVTLLAVTGVVTGRDRGVESVLLGKRSTQTRVYPGTWELVPSGGLERPESEGSTFGFEQIIDQLRRELHEETGFDIPLERAALVAGVTDPIARSFDLVVRLEVETPVERLEAGESDWELDEVRWVPLREAKAFVDAHEMNPSTVALLGHFGWL